MLAFHIALWLCKTPVYGGQATRGARQKVKAVIRELIHFSACQLHSPFAVDLKRIAGILFYKLV